jgi:anti-anti-sigma factor
MSESASPARFSNSSTRPVGELDDLGLSCDVAERASGVVVTLRGELDLATAPDLQRRLLELIARPVESLTLDLAQLTFLDSSGLGALYRARQAADEQGVVLRLAEVPEHVMRVLDVTAMAQIFDLGPRPA